MSTRVIYDREAKRVSIVPVVNGLRYAGKRLTAKKVAAVIDGIPHRIYVEPFAGLASVMKYKKPSEREIVSDLDARARAIKVMWWE